MPELPEVETIRRGLERELLGRTVTDVDWRGAKLRSESPRDLVELVGRRFVRAERHGKFLLLRLDDASTLVIHLGMTGKVLFAKPADNERPHTHLRTALDDGRELRFVDPRRFGTVQLLPRGGTVPELAAYGPDALSAEFTVELLAQLLQGSRAPLKAFLLDQSKLAGVGNIYACEALWRARLAPKREARTVTKAKAAALHAAVVQVLRDAIDGGGTSFNDYVDHIGEPGRYVASLAVFQREGEPCPRCGAKVRRIVQSNRSTFFCAKCQR